MRENQRLRTGHYPNPARGGTRGYPLWLCTKAMNSLEREGSYQIAARTTGCSTSSVRRWARRILPYRISGGAQRESLTGADQLLLSICLFIYPAAAADEIAIFIHVNGGEICTRPQIIDQCNELELTRKKASKESYDDFSITSRQALRWYKTLPPPPWCTRSTGLPIH